jgi:hypothetical protein
MKIHNNKKEKKKVLHFYNHVPFILQAHSPMQQPSPPFPNKHEKCQTTLMKPPIQNKHTPHSF